MFRQLLHISRWSRLTTSRLFNPSCKTVCVKWSRTITSTISLHSQQEVASNSDNVRSNGEIFQDLFKASKFVNMVDPVGKIVDGRVIAVDGDKLYVDFGGKFHGVVEGPKAKANRYIKGAKVKVLIKDMEVGMHFLGSNRDTSLLEASIDLVGLA